MAENQDTLKITIGNEEVVALKPTNVKITDVEIKELGVKKAKKVVCTCKHPDATDLIHISSVKYENHGKLETVGLWVNLDKKDLIRKGSALAVFIQSQGVKTIEELKGKEVFTAQDEKGYLCFKAY